MRLVAFTEDYPDKDFVIDLAFGIPRVGAIPPKPGLTSRKRIAEIPYQEWKGANPKRNAAVCDRVRKSRWADLANKCWGGTTSEIDLCWITEPVDVTDATLRTLPPTPRYDIVEHRGNTDP